MKTIKIILLLQFLLMFISCNGQDNKGKVISNNSIKDSTFIIGNYMLIPKLKEIRVYTMIGGVNWDGFEYRKVPNIDYEKTILLLLDNNVFLKENFPFNYDLDKLKMIYKDEFWSLCKDDKNIYYTTERLKPTKIDISNYKRVNDFVYKSKSGELFFVDIERYKLTQIAIDIDESSIKHIVGNYYYDKNGLYFFGAHNRKNKEGYYDNYIEKSEKLVDAQNAIPKFSKKYIAFANQVFAVDGNQITKLDINANTLIEVNIGSTESFITDGKTIYSNMNYGYDKRNANGYFGIWYPTLFSGVNLQRIYPTLLNFKRENNSIVFNKNDPNNFPGLIATMDNNNYLLTDKKKVKIDKMLFYHPENKTTETFDEKWLKIFPAERFIQYKSVLYFDGIPVKTSKLDLENLREIENSNFLTDGKAIFYIGNVYGYGSPTINGIDYATFDDRILENAYTSKMTAINPDILSDSVTIISKQQKIKIKDLNLNVKIVE